MMLKLIILFCLTLSLAYAETQLAEPKPSIIEPRKVVFPIKSSNPDEIHHVLSIANNILKFYGPENVHLRIVAYSHGIEALLKNQKEITVRIETLKQYDVEFVGCAKSMETKKISKDELIEGVEIVSSGAAEIIERSQEGWIYLVP